MRKVLILMSCILVVVVILSGTAYARVVMHGNVGVIEYPENCTYRNFAWAFVIVQKPGSLNWVHFTLPTNIGERPKYIRLKFHTGSVDAIVSDIHVYDGNVKKKEFTGLNLSNGWKDLQLDLGGLVKFIWGIGISVKIVAGGKDMSHQFKFTSVGINPY